MLGSQIFKRDTNGKVRTWRFEVSGTRWRSLSGILDGAIVESGWISCVPRSRPTGEEQAIFEADAEMGKKLDKDYFLTVESIDDERSFGEKPMLAQKFETLTGPCFSQPKLDGMRCKVNRHGLWSRSAKLIVSCPHIFSIFAPYLSSGEGWPIDGELYNHELKDDFPRLMSILRKSKPTEDDLAEAAEMAQIHVYDVYRPGMSFSERDKVVGQLVAELDSPLVVKVPTTPVSTLYELDEVYGQYIQDGYEGQMVRLDGPYENKRSKLLLKRKEFETKEFELIAIEEGRGRWAGLAKKVRFRLEDGRPCGGGIRGSSDRARQLLDEPLPSIVTVRFFGRSPDGIPRFPVAVDFDRPDTVTY